METKAIAIITYNRPEYLMQCFRSVYKHLKNKAQIIVVDDCSDNETQIAFLKTLESHGVIVHRNTENSGVAVSKNVALTAFMEAEIEHMFLIEDDIIVTSPDVLDEYVDYAEENHLGHLNFAHHGPANVGASGVYNGIQVYPNIVGAFSYYHRKVIEDVGLMDTQFKNAWEHVEHTYRIALKGYTTPFWYFADHPMSTDYLKETEGSIHNSVIRPRDDWERNITEGKEYFIKKHGSWLPEFPIEYWRNNSAGRY